MGTLFVLVGPKGAGKSHLGAVLQRELGVGFLRVEPIFLDVIRTLGRGAASEREGFRRVGEEVEGRLATTPALVIESTGASDEFAPFLARLRERHCVMLFAIRAPLDVCAERVRTRDATNHIPVSDDLVAQVNARAVAVSLPWDGEFDNSGPAPEREFVRWFSGRSELQNLTMNDRRK